MKIIVGNVRRVSPGARITQPENTERWIQPGRETINLQGQTAKVHLIQRKKPFATVATWGIEATYYECRYHIVVNQR